MPFPGRVSARGWAYWLVYPRERRMVPKVKRFREWLMAEISAALVQLATGDEPTNAEFASVEYRDQTSV
jgi:LysR family glycine cleavage system transcriptional activator